MTTLPKRQSGMTAISFAMLLALIGFVAVIFVKLIPVYLENFKITAAVNALEDDARAQGASVSEVKELLLKKLDIDDVDKVGEDDIVIKKLSEGLSVTVNHETRIRMFGNVDAVVKYEGPVVTVR
ncbi:MAG TPA: DUF4845 domain-containing protein [Candidatus Tenderia sp.]|nr:DUF4845 domain-containing protein [Candidatus Tenderia sp.]